MNPAPPDPAALRRAAETRLRRKPPPPQPQTEVDLRRLQHELEVHQVELEIQNEELRFARDGLEAALARYTDLYDFAPVGYLTLDRNAAILEANFAAARLLGCERGLLPERLFSAWVVPADRPSFADFLGRVFGSETAQGCEVTLLSPANAMTLHVRIEAAVSPQGFRCRAALLDVSARHRAEVQRERAIAELQAAAAHVKQLSGLLPICAGCKKIRDDAGYWQQIESYIASHSEAHFSHGMCPECARKYYPDIYPSATNGPPETAP